MFGVRNLLPQPACDLVVATSAKGLHLRYGFPSRSGALEILTLPTAIKKAAAIVPLLLKAFTEARCEPVPGDTSDTTIVRVAPFSWAVDDPSLVPELEAQLRQHGVRDSLCSVTVCSAEQVEVLRESWSPFDGGLKEMGRHYLQQEQPQTPSGPSTQRSSDNNGNTACYRCGLSQEAVPGGLKTCAKCKKAWYCSRQCQIDDWKTHKKTDCAMWDSVGPGFSADDAAPAAAAQDHYNTVASTNGEAKTLAASLNLALPNSPNVTEAVM